MNLLDKEKALYSQVWEQIDRYGEHAPGEANLPYFMQNIARLQLNQHITETTILDAGCGSAKGAVKLAEMGFKLTLVDITNAGIVPEATGIPYYEAALWDDLYEIAMLGAHDSRARKFDFVYCTDVLEHIPTQFTMLAINQMLRVAKHGLFLSISLVPDNFGVMVGDSLHQTVQSFTWWRDSLRELGDLQDARDLHVNGVFFLAND